MIEYLTEQEVLNMDTNYIIETKNLTKQYGSQKSVADLNLKDCRAAGAAAVRRGKNLPGTV